MNIHRLDRTLTFIHIPKTAGTSVTNYFANQFLPSDVSTQFYGDYDSLPRDVKFRSGHFRFREIHALAPSHYITFLRHPVARTISQYKSWHDPSKLDSAWLNDPNVAHVRWAQTATLEEFVMSDHPHIRASIENVQTSLLSHHHPSDWRFLASSMRTLERDFCFVGIVEQFSESLDLLRSTFDGLGEYAVPKESENRSAYEDLQPTPAALVRIMELNWADMALYQFALRRFQEQLANLNRRATLGAA